MTFQKGNQFGKTNKGRRGQTPWNKGLSAKDDIRISKSIQAANKARKDQLAWNKGLKGYKMGENSYGWKGENVSYVGLHQWLYRELGQSDTCKFCGQTGLKGKKIHWANKSGKYKRELTDWIRLCMSCHWKYDRISEKRNRNFQGRFI